MSIDLLVLNDHNMNCSGPIMTENQAIRTVGCSFFIDLVPFLTGSLVLQHWCFKRVFLFGCSIASKSETVFLGYEVLAEFWWWWWSISPYFHYIGSFSFLFVKLLMIWRLSVCSVAVIKLSLFIFSSFCHATSFPLGYLQVQPRIPS